jgi:hypothetical protein
MVLLVKREKGEDTPMGSFADEPSAQRRVDELTRELALSKVPQTQWPSFAIKVPQKDGLTQTGPKGRPEPKKPQ